MSDVVARKNEKMIRVTLRLRTNGIAKKKGKIRQKHAWGEGWLDLGANNSHGIDAGAKASFNSLGELTASLEKLLIKGQIKLHLNRRAAQIFVK